MTTIYLMRHGDVENPAGILYGRLPGFGLSVKGHAQIERAAKLLSDRGPFAALAASPLQRAQESAAIVAASLNLEIETDPRIIETDMPAFQGKPQSVISDFALLNDPEHEGMESATSIRERMLDWVGDMCRLYPGGKVVGVSHADPIAITILHFRGLGLDERWIRDLDTGSIFEFPIDADGNAANVDKLPP